MENVEVWLKIAKCFGAALAIGLGTIGPALSQGKIGASACENLGKYPQGEKAIKDSSFLGLALVETATVFSFVTAMIIAFVV